MATRKSGKKSRERSPAKVRREKRRIVERRSGAERRRKTSLAARDRRAKARPREAGRSIRDLYKTDLDRHLWTWPLPSARKKRQKDKERRRRRRKIGGIIASAAGALGAAGLSFFLYRRLHEDEEQPLDPENAQADLDEADFEE
jgi:hypothetical protein